MESLRYDKAKIEIDERHDGFLRAKVILSKPGVYPYLLQNGQIRLEAKLPEEILSQKTLETFKGGVPVTDGHPSITENNGFVTPENYSSLVRGIVSDVQIGDNYLHGYETVFDKKLIESLKAGEKREVSIGFKTDIDETPGIFNGQRYDAVQRNIRINHVAHVEQGNAGHDVKIILDSKDNNNYGIQQGDKIMADITPQVIETPPKEDGMVKAILDGLKKMFSKEEVVEDALPKPDETGNQGIMKKLEDEIASLKSQIAEITKMAAPLETSKMDEAIKTRSNLVEIAKTIIPEFKHDGLTDNQIKTSVIKKIMPNVEIKQDSSNDMINAYYDASCELARKDASKKENVKLDSSNIEELKKKRLNLYKGAA